jgi:hypothetical protein
MKSKAIEKLILIYKNHFNLRLFYENHFGFSYDRVDSRPFDNKCIINCWQFRDYEFVPNIDILNFGVEVGFFTSKSEGRRKLKEGAVRIGSNHVKTPYRQCVKLQENQELQPNDFIRMGLRMFGMIPRKPTPQQELIYFMEQIFWFFFKTDIDIEEYLRNRGLCYL